MKTLELTYDIWEDEFVVGDMTLREWFLKEVEQSDYSIYSLQIAAGISHPLLQQLKSKSKNNGKYNKSPKQIFRALELLGYKIQIVKGE